MFYIKSLEFSGIRCFPQGVERNQQIVFDTSNNKITIIHGENGTGKTTIMEVLKFALTGIRPSSPDLLTSFIRDPFTDVTYNRNYHQDSVGRIQLCLVENHSIEWTIIWDMKRLGGRTSCTEPKCKIWKNGEPIFSGKSLKESSEKVIQILRINPGVWENVIMVPQEEVLWPFSEPGDVMTRFDILFELADKKKKLKSLVEEKNKLPKKINDLKPTLDAAELRFKEYQKKDYDLQIKTMRERHLEEEKVQLRQNYEPIHQELEEIVEAKGLMEQIERNTDYIGSASQSIQDIQNIDLQRTEEDLKECEVKIEKMTASIVEARKNKDIAGELYQAHLRERQRLTFELNKCQEEDKVTAEANEKIKTILDSIGTDARPVNSVTDELGSRIEIHENTLKDLKVKGQKITDLSQRLEGEKRKEEQILNEMATMETDENVTISKRVWNNILDFMEKQKVEQEGISNLKNAILKEGENLHIEIGKLETEQLRSIALQEKLKLLEHYLQSAQFGSRCPICFNQSQNPTALLEMEITKVKEELNKMKDPRELSERRRELQTLILKEQVQLALSPLIEEIDSESQSNFVNANANGTRAELMTGQPSVTQFEFMDLNTAEPDSTTLRKRALQSRLSESQSVIQELQTELDNCSPVRSKNTRDSFSYLSSQYQEERSKVDQIVAEVKKLSNWKQQLESLNGQVKLSRTLECKSNIEKCDAEIIGAFGRKKDQEENFEKLNESKSKLQETESKLREQKKNQKIYQDIQNDRGKLELLRGNDPQKYQNLEDVKTSITEMEATLSRLKQQMDSNGEELTKTSQVIDELIKNELNGNILRSAPEKFQHLLNQNNELNTKLTKLIQEAGNLRAEIVRIHELKLQQINVALKESWERIYPRDNIAFIQVFSEIKNEGEKRVDYNYHFDMVLKNGEILKMRGRCSLGEKYLASIIIRYALATVFAPEWPIFGFDTPDGNMDDLVETGLIALFKGLSEESPRKQIIITSPCSTFIRRAKTDCPNSKTYNLEKINGKASLTREE